MNVRLQPTNIIMTDIKLIKPVVVIMLTYVLLLDWGTKCQHVIETYR